MARRPAADPEFGSDSFLDIVANVVGILVILIVLVGLRVGQAALESVAETAAPEPAAEPNTPPAAVTLMPLPPPARPPGELISVPERTEPELRVVIRKPDKSSAIAPDPRLIAAIAEAEKRLAALAAEAARLAAARKTAEADAKRQAKIADSVAAETARLTSLTATADAESRDAAAAVASLGRDLAAALRAKAETELPPVEQLRHDLSPAARRINGAELHFLIAGGAVAEVPLESLTAELRPSIGRQVNFLARSGRATGEVGPIGGFRLRYLVETGGTGLLDDLRQRNAGGIRVRVAGYKVLPEPTLRGETAAEALDADSAFRRALDLARPGTALTFWVYPDGFDAFAELQRFAHRAGFKVAGRPLPEGVPITGSPSGSKSLGR